MWRAIAYHVTPKFTHTLIKYKVLSHTRFNVIEVAAGFHTAGFPVQKGKGLLEV